MYRIFRTSLTLLPMNLFSRHDLNRCCAALAGEYPFANALNSQARQEAAERAANAISVTNRPGIDEQVSKSSNWTLAAIPARRKLVPI